MSALTEEKCVPCESDVRPLSEAERNDLLRQLPGWTLLEKNGVPRLTKYFNFKGFREPLEFANLLGDAADEADHHPEILLEYGRATATWWTHNINGLHRNDFIMAARTDQIYQEGGWKTST